LFFFTFPINQASETDQQLQLSRKIFVKEQLQTTNKIPTFQHSYIPT
jgi:hypothetical protein